LSPELVPHVPEHEWLRVRVTTGDLVSALEDWLCDNAVHWPSCGEPFPEGRK